MSGGWADKEFCDHGFNTLLIERGRNVEHPKDYPTTNLLPWEFKHRGDVPAKIREENPIAHSCYAFREDAMHFFCGFTSSLLASSVLSSNTFKKKVHL